MKQEEIRVEVRLKEFCSRHGRNYSDFSINSEGTVDCKTDVVISGDDLIEGKLPFKFGKVEGFFSCKFLNIISLEGSPREVDGDFDCMVCDKLTSLKGAPQIVGGDFWCSECKNLKLLEGAPIEVGGDFWSNDCNNLISLKGAPQHVGGDFCCCRLKNLISLKGAPIEVGGNFLCGECKMLTSLKGAPQKVGGYFYCTNCGKKFYSVDEPEGIVVNGDFIA